MKSFPLVALMGLAIVPFGLAQRTTSTTDVLGAHLNYGRGCSACHAPHSGTTGSGSVSLASPSSRGTLLWGENADNLYGKTITTGGGQFAETLPSSLSADTPDVAGMLTCLSCHDGNYATGAMMKNKLYESLPASYGKNPSIPTLLGRNGPASYLTDHPAGLNARIACGGAKGWDCSISSAGEVRMTGAHSSQFVSNYGFFVQPGVYNNSPVVVCSTCHDPHSMTVVTVKDGSSSGLPAGNYTTMFFLRGPYNPGDTGPTANQTAQFCRQCHADKSNEMNGSTAVTVF